MTNINRRHHNDVQTRTNRSIVSLAKCYGVHAANRNGRIYLSIPFLADNGCGLNVRPVDTMREARKLLRNPATEAAIGCI